MNKTSNEIFKNWLNAIPTGKYQDTVKALAEHCCVTVNVVSFWKQGRTQIKPAYQKLINEFAGKKIFTLKK